VKSKLHRQLTRASLLLILIVPCVPISLAQGTAFSYQGKLTEGGIAANGQYDFQFKLFDAVSGGTQQGASVTQPTVQVSGGVFTVQLDFGAPVFDGSARYLEIGVRPAGSGNLYTVLAPRRQVTPTPYAIQTINAAQLGGLPPSRFVQLNALGNVGIGTPTPGYRLHIAGDNTAGGGFALVKLENKQPSGHSYWLYSGALAIPEDFGIYDESAGDYRFYIKGTNGNVGIGATDPQAKLDVNGDVHIRAGTLSVNGNFAFAPLPESDPACLSPVFSGLAALGSCASSLRYKSDVQTFIGGMEIVNRLRPIRFAWKRDGRRDIGLAAEEVEKVEPLLTFRNGKGEIEGVRYNQLSAIFINAFKEQQAQIEAQQQQIRQQQSEIEGLKRLVCLTHPAADLCQAQVKP
jgi:Chaperone of endosialidase